MYTTKVQVPFIGSEVVDTFFQGLPPQARAFVNIPTVDTAEKAQALAVAKVVKDISTAPYEFVREVSEVVLDEDAKVWNVSVIVSGD